VDRVDEHHDGALEIVDYKSGRESVTEEDVAGSLALGVYQLLLKRKYPDRRVFATLVALRTGSQASHELSGTDQENLAAECLETGDRYETRTGKTPCRC
jgi:RecB family exonuclease